MRLSIQDKSRTVRICSTRTPTATGGRSRDSCSAVSRVKHTQNATEDEVLAWSAWQFNHIEKLGNTVQCTDTYLQYTYFTVRYTCTCSTLYMWSAAVSWRMVYAMYCLKMACLYVYQQGVGVGKGPVFECVSFSLAARSPLLQHYLVTHGLAEAREGMPGPVVGRTQISQLPYPLHHSIQNTWLVCLWHCNLSQLFWTLTAYIVLLL